MHATFSLCFIIEIYGKAKESWLYTNKTALHSGFVSLRRVWELTAHTVTIQIIMLSLSINEYSS